MKTGIRDFMLLFFTTDQKESLLAFCRIRESYENYRRAVIAFRIIAT
jgi:hypothetical protein